MKPKFKILDKVLVKDDTLESPAIGIIFKVSSTTSIQDGTKFIYHVAIHQDELNITTLQFTRFEEIHRLYRRGRSYSELTSVTYEKLNDLLNNDIEDYRTRAFYEHEITFVRDFNLLTEGELLNQLLNETKQ